MAKITRYNGNLLAFASAATGTERTVFGDVTQADDLATNITADFLRGWGIVGVNENPTRQDFNAVAYTISQILAYLHQVGVAEYNAAQEYHTYSVTNYNGVLYFSTIDTNIGNTPGTDANWRLIPSSDISYDNTISGLTATDVKAAIDELVAALAALTAADIAYDNTGSGLTATDAQAAIDEVHEARRAKWTSAEIVGSGLTIATIGNPALAALNSTDVAFIDGLNDELRTYRWNGSTWALVGSGLAIATIGNPALSALNGTDVAFIDAVNDELRTYRFGFYIGDGPYHP